MERSAAVRGSPPLRAVETSAGSAASPRASVRRDGEPRVAGGPPSVANRYAMPGCRRHTLLVTAQVSVSTIECGAARGTSQHTQAFDQPAIVFVRTGRYQRRFGARTSMVDSTQCYILQPGDEELVQHFDGGHRSTVLTVASEHLPALLRVRSRFAATEFRTSPASDLAHRVLLAECRRGGAAAAITDMALTLVADLVAAWTHSPRAAHRRGTSAATRRAVDIARELGTIGLAPPSLQSIASAASVSPQYLTRLFRQSTGLTMSRYRNRVRVRLALERLAEGEGDLKRIALELGFYDQSHFSKIMRAEIGLQPSTLRSLLSAPDRTP
jgi:AraC-like DNA-binding protein